VEDATQKNTELAPTVRRDKRTGRTGGAKGREKRAKKGGAEGAELNSGVNWARRRKAGRRAMGERQRVKGAAPTVGSHLGRSSGESLSFADCEEVSEKNHMKGMSLETRERREYWTVKVIGRRSHQMAISS